MASGGNLFKKCLQTQENKGAIIDGAIIWKRRTKDKISSQIILEIGLVFAVIYVIVIVLLKIFRNFFKNLKIEQGKNLLLCT